MEEMTMRHVRDCSPTALAGPALLALAGLVLLAGCGGSAGRGPGTYAPHIDPLRFTDEVDNPFFPLAPGTHLQYEDEEGDERVEVTVTDRTRPVMDVTCREVESREYAGGELVEQTLDWYAQAADGSVWYFGEDTRTYRDGRMVGTAGSWEAGRDGALPGIIMPGVPQVGDKYRQEYAPGRAEDMGEIVDLAGTVNVPYGAFDEVVVTRDWSPLEPAVSEHKYYVRGVGLVLELEGDHRVELVRVSLDQPGED
jgi:hypothetical protein